MQEFDINKVSLRALKIIRKGYKNNRRDPQNGDRLQQINDLIDRKQRVYTKSKKVMVAPPKPIKPNFTWPALTLEADKTDETQKEETNE